MNLEPSEEQRQIVASVRRFVREEIVPLEVKLDPDAVRSPHSVVRVRAQAVRKPRTSRQSAGSRKKKACACVNSSEPRYSGSTRLISRTKLPPMAMGKRRQRATQTSMWVATSDLLRGAEIGRAHV